jgi:NADH:ubiquinone oxidoreductase subunit 5 (subunit L)/multisubunit Na+/H+ antiporter MnhA subunit
MTPAPVGSVTLLLALWLLPLLGAIVLWTFGPQLRRSGGIVASALVLVSFVLTFVLFLSGTSPDNPLRVPLVSWAHGFNLGLELDPLSLLWTLIITGVAASFTCTRSVTCGRIKRSRDSSPT